MLNKCIVYVDEPSAWRVPIAGFIIQFLLVGYIRSCSLLLIGIGEDYDVNESLLLTTAIVNIALEKLMAFLAERLYHFCGARAAVLISTFFAFICTLVPVLLPITDAVVISFLGIGMGIATALAPLPVYSATAQALEKRRGVAISFVKAGVSLGSICFPPLLVFLMERFSTRGALFILSGILCNGLVAAILLPSDIINRETGMAITTNSQNSCFDCCRIIRRTSEIEDHEDEDDTKELNSKSRRASKSKPLAEKRPLLIRLPLVINYCCISLVCLTCFSQLSNVYQMFAHDVGLTKYMIAATLSVCACVDFGSRFVIGFLSDKLSARERLVLMSSILMVTGSFTIVLGFAQTSLAMVFSFTTIFGIGIAQTAVGWIAIMVGFTDVTLLPRFMSMTLTMVGVVSLLFIIVIRKVLKETNSYRPLIVTYGVLMMCSSVNCLISALIFRSCKRINQKNEVNLEDKGSESD